MAIVGCVMGIANQDQDTQAFWCAACRGSHDWGPCASRAAAELTSGSLSFSFALAGFPSLLLLLPALASDRIALGASLPLWATITKQPCQACRVSSRLGGL